MHLPAQILNDRMTLIAALLLIATLLLAIRSARWRALQDVPGRMHLVAGGAVACLMLWLLNIHLADGLVMHFLGVTTLTLVVGWSFSVIAACAVLVGFYLIQGLEWSAFPVSACLTVLLPATLTRLLARLLYRPRLRHLFIYILGAGFAGGGLVVLALAVSTVALLALLGQHERVELALQWWPLICLLMFSEAFINGMCISALAIFRPDAVKTFDDAFYLDDQ